jgi:glutaredoxin 3
VTQPAVTVYLTAWCPYCQRAKALLAAKQLAFDEIDVEADPKFRQEMLARSGRRTVPQIFMGERHLGGCDDLYALEERGELDKLIRGES